ncbi:uncharacterized protein JCM15063_004946 [Sporobolomyces koalae]|uniref:uncharacterized protein n=1 Tax=Sporobolomyces koalae TaxID=500713 RepID=UPI003172D09E
MKSSPRSTKRARSPRLLESPVHTAISTSSPLEPEPRAEGRKKHKQANETVQDPPALYYLPEVDEDGNPVEDEPPPACKIPSPVLSHARIPFRPVSPAKRSSGQVALNSARSAVASPRPSVSPSIKDHAAQAAKPLDQVSTTPFSSSFDLPDQIARRIRQTSASCSPSRTLSSEAVSPADQSLFDELGSRDTARQQEQRHEIKRHGQQQAGEMSGQIELGESANTLVELPLESGSGHPLPLSGTQTQWQTEDHVSAFALSVSAATPSITPAPARTPRAIESVSLHPNLIPAPRRPPPQHRLVPLTLEGLTSHLQYLVTTALTSTLPLSQFGFVDPLNRDHHDGNDDEFGRGEIGALRREVNRLADEVVERNAVIRDLSHQVRVATDTTKRVAQELEDLESVLNEVEMERDAIGERLEWMKEAKKGLLRELKESEARVVELETTLANAVGRDDDPPSKAGFRDSARLESVSVVGETAAMDIPITSAGQRRPSAFADHAITSHSARSDLFPPASPRVGESLASPRLGSTPRMHGSTASRHQRKDSNDHSTGDSPSSSLLSRWFSRDPTKDRRSSKSTLPTYGSARAASGAANARPFYSDGASGSSPSAAISVVRNLIIRPIYILSRKPLYPVIGFFFFFFVYLSTSSSNTSQRVTSRVKGAVGPYIPQRAADAVKWGSGRGFGLGTDNLLGGGGRGNVKQQGRTGATKGRKQKPLMRIDEIPTTRRDGRIVLEEGKPHPIPAMMAKAKEQWRNLKTRQSKTFREAVAEYKRRYGRRPPKGFDRWYAFAKAHKVLLIDEFDLINEDLMMYRAFPPSIFRRRVDHLADPATFDTTWIIRIEKGRAIREGQLAHHDRAVGVVKLMERFVRYLPDMKIVYNGHDGARIAVAAEERIRLEGLVRQGQYDDDAEPPFWPKEKGPFPQWGMPVFCPPGSPARALGFEQYGYHGGMEATGLEMIPPVEGSIGSVIGDFKHYMDVCDAPHYRHTHATTSWVFAHHPTQVLPMFTPGVQTTFGDVHALIVEQLELEMRHDPSWEERPFTALQWRGQTSGPLWEKATPWQTTQRARLHLMSHQEDGYRNITITDENDIMRSTEVPNYRVNPLFLDTGMVGPAVQCVQEDGTCDKMYQVFQGYDKRISFDRASLYKYVLDVDGNSWSGRFRRLMLSNAAVVKATIFREFWTDWAIPWLHFIPMQVDYSDMWDIMAFFRGGINGEGAHDQLGKDIAQAGKEWVKECYRWADLEAYQFRLMLEYGRLYTDETVPGSNDFTGDDSLEPIWNGPVVL